MKLELNGFEIAEAKGELFALIERLAEIHRGDPVRSTRPTPVVEEEEEREKKPEKKRGRPAKGKTAKVPDPVVDEETADTLDGEPAVDKTPELTREDLYTFLSKFVENHGKGPVKALLGKLGADKIADLKKDQYSEFVERLAAYAKKNGGN